MNDRIKELADQAEAYADYNFKGEHFWTQAYDSKFAELMINDCIKELEISRRCDPYTGKLYDCEYNTCIKEQIEVLKARFGVN
jgi:hypothetical protein